MNNVRIIISRSCFVFKILASILQHKFGNANVVAPYCIIRIAITYIYVANIPIQSFAIRMFRISTAAPGIEVPGPYIPTTPALYRKS